MRAGVRSVGVVQPSDNAGCSIIGYSTLLMFCVFRREFFLRREFFHFNYNVNQSAVVPAL